ncbi:hypothetical protein H6P81_015046 [Aristolochia fimbriata]|uniref:Uncharacterized protein n=1 Tax=Aristolochia fimbriata TaxID=158543 RepID=A0AAV7E5N5_ARIFI|nr:hypothetical protein H6P81_015046 [Aristolochia fimbriata]
MIKKEKKWKGGFLMCKASKIFRYGRERPVARDGDVKKLPLEIPSLSAEKKPRSGEKKEKKGAADISYLVMKYQVCHSATPLFIQNPNKKVQPGVRFKWLIKRRPAVPVRPDFSLSAFRSNPAGPTPRGRRLSTWDSGGPRDRPGRVRARVVSISISRGPPPSRSVKAEPTTLLHCSRLFEWDKAGGTDGQGRRPTIPTTTTTPETACCRLAACNDDETTTDAITPNWPPLFLFLCLMKPSPCPVAVSPTLFAKQVPLTDFFSVESRHEWHVCGLPNGGGRGQGAVQTVINFMRDPPRLARDV